MPQGITDGPGDTGLSLSVSATSNNPTVIPNPSVTYTSPNTAGSLTYTPVPFSHGNATITVTVTDSGSTANNGQNTVSQSFLVQVTQVNQQPTLNGPVVGLPIPNLVLPANPGQQSIGLTDITAGPGDSGQTLTVSAASSNTAVVANPISVLYTSPNSTGTLVFTPVAGASGLTTITVVVQDNGGTAAGGVNFVSQSFTVAVNPAHAAPVVTPSTTTALTYLQNQAPTPIDPGITVTDTDSTTLTGATVAILSPSFNPSQDVLGFTLQSGITGSYSAASGVLTLSGTASLAAYQSVLQSVTYFNSSNFPNGGLLTPVNRTVQFTVNDGDPVNGLGSAFRSIVITPVNHAPTLGALENSIGQPLGNNVQLLENAGTQTINLTGIMDGNNGTESLTVTAAVTVTSGTLMIPAPVINYVSPNTFGSITYTPALNTFGLATITVTVTNSGTTANGGQNSVSQSFNLDVGAVNLAPTLDPITSGNNSTNPNNYTLLENAAPVTVPLTGITAGPGQNEFLTVSAAVTNTTGTLAIIGPTVSYTSGQATGSLTFAPMAFTSGTATITVTVMSNGGTANGGLDMVSQSFTVTVLPVNQPPTLAPVLNPTSPTTATATINGGAVNGITVTSGGSGYIVPPTVTLSGGGYTTPATATAIVNSSGVVTGFTITSPGSGYTSAPTVTISNNFTSVENSNPATVTVNLSGIAAGLGDNTQTLSVFATSSNPQLVPNPAVTYTNPSAIGSLTFTPAALVSGVATITVTVMDNGGTANGGVDTITQTFNVTITPVNQQPTFTVTGPAAIVENAGQQTVPVTGISVGQGDTATATAYIAATATASIAGGTVNAITVTYGDTGYTSPPVVTLTGGGFTTPATATAVLTNGVVTAITVSGGAGYTSAPVVTIAPPTTTGGISAITLTDGGNGYTSVPTVTITGGGGSGATATAIVTDGLVTGITITNPGSGYTSAPRVTIADGQTLTITATSNNLTLIPNPTFSFTDPHDTTGVLTYTPAANMSGTATITLSMMDTGGTLNNGVDTLTQTFTVTVTQVNQPPTLDPIVVTNPQINENAGQQTINLTGISPGPGDAGETVTITATSNNTNVIPNPTVIFPPNNTTGTLTFTPVPFTFGSATITVNVTNSGLGGSPGLTTTQTFTIAVLHVNQAPTLNPIPNPATLLENATLQTITLGGISPGQGDNGQTLMVTATSSNPNVIPDPSVVYTSPNGTGSLSFTPVPNAHGTATITVTVMDDGGVTNNGVDTIQQTFTVTVAAVNQAPTLAMIPNPAPILENAGQQTVTVGGISDGNNGSETVTVTASSSNPGLIPNPTVTFTDDHQTNQTGTLTFTPVANVSGSAVITVTVMNNGSTVNGGITTVFQSFTVTVLPVNTGVSFNTIPPLNIAENAGPQSIPVTGITNGAGNPASTLTLTATSDNTALIPNTGPGALAVTYTSPNASGTLTFTPVTGASGTATITVTLSNGGSTANGGTNNAHPDLPRHRCTRQPAAHAQPDHEPQQPQQPQQFHDPREQHHAADRQPHGHCRRRQ